MQLQHPSSSFPAICAKALLVLSLLSVSAYPADKLTAPQLIGMVKSGDANLAAAISATPDFANAILVLPEFTGTQLSVPHSSSGVLYLKLRDDPRTVQTLTLPVLPMLPPTAQPAAPPIQPTADPAPTTPAPVTAKP